MILGALTGWQISDRESYQRCMVATQLNSKIAKLNACSSGQVNKALLLKDT